MVLWIWKEGTEFLKENFYVNDDYDVTSNIDEYKGELLRINHKACEEIKVIYNKEFEMYMNVVKTKDGRVYYVQL